MAAVDLITLADLKASTGLQGNAKDGVLPLSITAASRWIENVVGRRLVYRAPATTEAAVLAAQAWATGALVVGAPPNAAGRTLVVTFSSASAGVLTVTGTVGGQAGVTETFDAANGLVQHGLKFFTAVASAAATGAAGGGTVTVKTSQGYTEFHRAYCDDPAVIYPLEWPVQNVLEVNEDTGRSFGASTRLVAGTDYVLEHGEDGDRLIRLSSALPTPWSDGWRPIRQLTSAGYTVATVPAEAKDVCRRLAKLLHDEISKGLLEIASGSNALGNWSRFGPARLTREMSAALAPLKRRRFGAETGVRDFDLEAA